MFAGLALTLIMVGLGKVIVPNPSQTTTNIINLFATLGTIIAIYAIGAMVVETGPLNMNLKDPKLAINYLKGLVLGGLMIFTYLGLALALGALEFKGAGRISILNLSLYFLGFLIQGFSEELMVRGLIQEALAKKSRLLSILAPSLLFSLLHLGNDNFSFLAMVNTALIGLLFALMTDVTGSLWMASAAHSIWNFLLGPFLGLYVSGIVMDQSFLPFLPIQGKEGLSGGLYGPEGSFLLTLLIIAFIIPFLLKSIRAGKN